VCISASASSAALASFFTESLHDVLRELHADGQGDVLSFWALQGTTVAVIAVLALVNVRGTTWGGALQVVVTAVKVLSLAGIALLPLLVLPFLADPAQ